MQLHEERLNGVVGLAHQLVEQIVLFESHLQHPGFQSRKIANAGLKRPMDSACLPGLERHLGTLQP